MLRKQLDQRECLRDVPHASAVDQKKCFHNIISCAGYYPSRCRKQRSLGDKSVTIVWRQLWGL